MLNTARVWAAGREKQGQVDLRVCVWDHYKQLAYLALRSGGVVWFGFLWRGVNQSHLGAQKQTRWSPKEYKVQRNPAKVCSRTYRVLENTSACSWETLISLSADTVSVWEIWLAWFFLLSFYSRTENFLEDTGKLLHLGICVQKFWRISFSPLARCYTWSLWDIYLCEKIRAVTLQWIWNVPGSDPLCLRGHEGYGDLHCPRTSSLAMSVYDGCIICSLSKLRYESELVSEGEVGGVRLT